MFGRKKDSSTAVLNPRPGAGMDLTTASIVYDSSREGYFLRANTTLDKRSAPNIEYSEWRRQAIWYRMQMGGGEGLPFDDIQTTMGAETVYVHVIADGKGVTLEDGREMFPSDTLVTQLRLLAR